MKKCYACLWLIIIWLHESSNAQILDTTGRWTWMGGTKAYNSAAVGSFRTAAGTNRPRSRIQSSTIWCDKKGKVWLFGGTPATSGIDLSGLNDMWVFDWSAGANGAWYWQGGPSAINGTCVGVKGGAAHVDNIPKNRSQAVKWIDKNGNLWLFGGIQTQGTAYNTYVTGNDLWTFNPDTKAWRWISGDTVISNTHRVGTYPSSIGNEGIPGGRGGAVTWTDTAGNLWMYGGSGVTTTTTAGNLGDIWKFDMLQEKWYWMGGVNTINAAVNYNGATQPGTPGGFPGGRQSLAGWRDQNDFLYIFSGVGAAGSGSLLSDMWRYNPASNEWTWWRASAPNASYGTAGIASASNEPGRQYIIGTATDKYGKFWMFSGRYTPGNDNMQNALWMFDPAANIWTMVNGYPGIDQKGKYGVMYTPDKSNRPGSRQSFMCYCEDQNELWMFGGAGWDELSTGRGVLSDLWRFARVVAPACTLTATISPAGSTSFCPGDSVVLRASRISGVSYEWRNGSAVLPQTADTIVVKTAGNYTVTLTDAICNITSGPLSVIVHPLPAADPQPAGAQSVCTGDTLTLRPPVAGMQYRWYRNSSQSGTDTVYKVTQAGAYTLVVTNTTTGCHDSSAIATTVSLINLPDAGIHPSGAQAICQGDSLHLQAIATTGNLAYTWHRDGVALTAGNTSAYNATLTGRYMLHVADATTGCSDTSSTGVLLTVNPLPVVSITPPGPADACEGVGIQLTVSTGSGYTYDWKKDQQTAGTGNPFTAGVTGNYYVVVTDGNHCRDSTAPVAVRILPVPDFTLTPGDTNFCAGSAVRYQVQANDTGLSYRWKRNGAIIPSADLPWYEASVDGIYSVVIEWRQVSQCADSVDSIRVTVHPLPVPSIEWDGIRLGTESGCSGYQWYLGGQMLPGATDSMFTPAINGAYTVIVTDTNNCSNSSVVYNVNDVNGVVTVSGNAQVRLYPNPVSSGVVYLSCPSPVNLIISQIDGQEVLKLQETRQINISDLPAGLYLVRIENREGHLLNITRLVKTGH